MNLNNGIVAIIFVVYSLTLFLSYPINNNLIATYIFSIIGTIVVIGLFNVYLNKGESFNSYPLIITSYIYIIIQYGLSLVLLSANTIINTSIIIEVILLAIFLIISMLLLKSKEYIEKIEKRDNPEK